MCSGITKRTVWNTRTCTRIICISYNIKIRTLMFAHIGVYLQFLHITVCVNKKKHALVKYSHIASF
jgi:hypothetical protein